MNESVGKDAISSVEDLLTIWQNHLTTASHHIASAQFEEASTSLTAAEQLSGPHDLIAFLRAQMHLGAHRPEDAAEQLLVMGETVPADTLNQLKRLVAVALANKGVAEINSHRVGGIPGACSDIIYGQQLQRRGAARFAMTLLSLALRLDPENERLLKLQTEVKDIAGTRL